MAFTRDIKSNRLLQSRRFTQNALGDAQEAFTKVLDINASEIYTQQNLIPTASLSYSGSSQNGSITNVNGQQILKFWYRQRLTPSDTLNSGETSYNTWFFLDPTSSADFTNGVNPGVVSTRQQTNFISPKYAPSLGGNTEDTTPGYQVKLTDNGTIVDPATYTFDYKTGVLEFISQSGYTSITKDIRLTAYQYIGRTLESDVLSGYTGSFYGDGSGLSIFQIASESVTASVSTNPNSLFLIKSGSSEYVKIESNSNTTINSNLFIVKNFTTQQAVLTVSQSVVQFATQSSAPPALNGGIWFTSTDLYVGLD